MKRSLCIGLAVLLTATACHHAPKKVKREHKPRSPKTEAAASATPGTAVLPDFAVDAVASQDGEAIWYDVPDQSLPQRKAWAEEMTAASDTLPQNSYVRIRRSDGQGEPVVVRITDRGVHRKGTLVDVSHAAAEALGIVRSGTTRVRVETLALKNASTDKPVEKKDDPVAGKASEISGTPAVGQRTEQAAAEAKTAR